MATITSSGSVSGINVSQLVSQLVAADRGPEDARLTKRDTQLTTDFTALSKLKGAMSTFQTALAGLKDANNFQLRKVSVSDTDALDVTATGASASGSYSVEIKHLATVGQLASAPNLTGSTATVGTGTLTISMGNAQFSVDINDSNKSLAGIRDAINGASGNVGVKATLIKAQDGTRLVLTGSATGAANALTVRATGGDGGLDQLVYDPTNNVTNLSVVGDGAQDAEIVVAGYTIKSTDNSVEDAVDGVTFNLKQAEVGKTLTVSVSNDDAGVQQKVQGFITAYNALMTTITGLRSYDAATQTAGPMLGDSMLLGIESQVRRAISDTVGSSTSRYSTLASLGITTQANGTLAMDAVKFAAAMKADPTAASQLFTSTKGISLRMDGVLTQHLAKTGDLAARDANIAAGRKDLDKQKTALDARMQVLQTRYTAQFSALDSLLTQMNSTSTYLTQQLSKSSSSS
jgi:flagellar hook-associated protein 2